MTPVCHVEPMACLFFIRLPDQEPHVAPWRVLGSLAKSHVQMI